ncbi:hypothetical protein D3C80_1416120 [compost metagenome]
MRQQFRFAIQRANARWAIEFVSGESVEVDIQFLHVGRKMDHALRAVDHYDNVVCMRNLNRAAEIRATTRDVRHLPQRQNPTARGDELRQARDIR